MQFPPMIGKLNRAITRVAIKEHLLGLKLLNNVKNFDFKDVPPLITNKYKMVLTI